LSKAETLGGVGEVAQRDWNVEREALSDAAFNTNRGSIHGRVTSS